MSVMQPKVGLFITCLVDAMRPSIGFASIKLLEQAGCIVKVPRLQTCCGQPAYNLGDKKDTKELARKIIDLFADFDYLVVPSGSCAGMIRMHYPQLFADDPDMSLKAHHLAARTYELTTFLVDVCNFTNIDAHYTGIIGYHDSCAGLRELNVKKQPRQLLHRVKGCQFKPLSDAETCCGFGGTFCMKYADISNEMVAKKTACIRKSGVDTLVAGDLGCLLNIAGKLLREKSHIKCYHVAEIIAGNTGDIAPIGMSEHADH